MEQSTKKVFVTGGTGMLGSHLLYSLVERGGSVKAIYRKKYKLDLVKKVFAYYSNKSIDLFNRIEWIESDADHINRLKKAITGSHHVYHCAATVSFDSSNRKELIENNKLIASNIVDTCLECGVEKLCHVSSISALGSVSGNEMINESSPWNDSDYHTAYSASKYLSESEVWNAVKKGLKAVIVNPSVILGPGDWDNGSPKFFKKIAEGMLFYTNGVTGYVDVLDVVKSMITLMNSPVTGERFIISSENLSFREFFSMIAQSLNVRKPFIPVPEILTPPVTGILKIISKISGKEGTLTPDIIHAAFSKVFFNNRKIKEATGITFIPINESVKRISRIYLMEKSGKD
jgi:dihydroflavonol-4-reductase